MRLLFEEITGKTYHYTLSDGSWFPPGSEDFLVTGAMANIIVSRRDSETVLLKGDLECHRAAVCDRCGEQVKEKMQGEFQYLVTTRKEPVLERSDIECEEEDVITLYLKEPEIDVADILREQTYLAVPFRTLCHEECKGICAGCGVDLNREICGCSLDKGSSAFAVLKKLTNS
ncbi:MAG: DUF177 domain-containing protein [Desulforhopalus sp.]